MTLFEPNIIDRTHPLNRYLSSWWLGLPSLSGSNKLYDVCGLKHATVAASTEWKLHSSGFTGLSFDGSSGQSANIANFTGPLNLWGETWMFWIYLPSVGGDCGNFLKVGNTYGLGMGIGNTTMENVGSKLIMLNENVSWKPTTYTMTAGWTHLAFHTVTNGGYAAFANGVRVYTSTQNFTRPSTTDTTKFGSDGGRAIIGVMRDIKVFNVYMSDAMIYEQYVESKNNYINALKYREPILTRHFEPTKVYTSIANVNNSSLSPISISNHKLNQGLVSWWLGLPHISGGNKLYDITQKNHSTLSSGLITWAKGRDNFSSLNFQSNNYTTATCLVNSAPFSFSCWVYPTENGGYSNQRVALWACNNTYATIALNVGRETSTSQYHFYVRATDGTYPVATSDASTAPLNTWAHVAGSLDGTNGTLRLYLNGKLCTTTGSLVGKTRATSNDIILFGAADYSGAVPGDTRYWKGCISDVRWYNRCLSDNEFFELYNESLSGYKNLLGMHIKSIINTAEPTPVPTSTSNTTVHNKPLELNKSNQITLGLVGAWLNYPHLSGGKYLYNLLGKNNGTVWGSPTYSLHSSKCSTIKFNGTDNYVTLPLILTAYPLTIMVKAKCADTTSYSPCVTLGQNLTPFHVFARIGFRGDASDKVEAVIAGTGVTSANSTDTFTANTWVTIAGTFSNSTTSVVYLNGVGTNSTTNLSSGPNTPTQFAVGRDALVGADGGAYGNVTIESVWVWNRILSASEIQNFHRDIFDDYKNIIGVSNKNVHNISQGIFKSIELLWDVYKAINKANSYLWDTYAAINNQQSLLWDTHALAGENSGLSWNVLANVSQNNSFLWDVAQQINKSNQLLWDVKELTNTSSEYLWNINEIVDKTNSYLWNTKAAVNNSHSYLWDVRAAIRNDKELLWNTYATSPANISMLWNVNALFGFDSSLLWDIKSLINKNSSLLWDARALANNSSNIIWNDYEIVNQNKEIVWNIKQAIDNAISLSWDDKQTVDNISNYLWNTRLITGVDNELVWKLKQAIEKDTTLYWDVFSTALVANQSSTLLWQTRSVINKARSLDWNIQALINKSKNLSWNDFITVGSDKTMYWDLLENLTSVVELMWKNREVISANKDLLWDTRAAVMRNRTILWDNLVAVGISEDILWDIRKKISKQLSSLYDIRKNITKTNALLWKVLVNTVINSIYEIILNITKDYSFDLTASKDYELDINISPDKEITLEAEQE